MIRLATSTSRLTRILLAMLLLLTDSSSIVFCPMLQAEESSVPRATVLKSLAAGNFAAGNYAQAAAYYEEAIQNGATLARQEQLDYAKALELTNALAKAQSVIQLLLKEHPDDKDALQSMAAIQMRRRDFSEAASAFKRLRALAPAEEHYAFSYAQTLLWAGQLQEAEIEITALLKRNPERQSYQELLAEATFLKKDFAKAGVLYSELAKIEPRKKEFHERAASSYFYAQKYAQAWQEYEWLREQKVLTPQTREEQASVANAMQKYDVAEASFGEMLQSAPRNPVYLQGLLDAQLGQKQFQAAQQTARRLLDLAPEDRTKQLRFAQICVWGKQYADAMPILQKLAEGPESGDVERELYADALFWGGDPAKACPVYEQLLAKLPDNVNIRFKLTDAAMAAQNFSLAALHLQVLFKSKPDDYSLDQRYIQALYLSNRHAEAYQRIKKYIAYAPPNKFIYRLAGDLAAEKREFEQAVTYYQRALELGDDQRDTSIKLARVLSWKRDYKQSHAIYDELIRQQPDDWETRREKARMYGWERKYRQSIATYDAMIQARLGGENVRLERAAKNAFYMQRDRSAIKGYRALLDKEPDNLEALFDLGQVYSRQSMWQPARESYRKTLTIYPEHYQAKQAMTRINRIADSYALTPSYSYERKKSTSREADIQTHTASAGLGRWIKDSWELGFQGGYERYELAENLGVNADTLRMQGRYVAHPNWDFTLSGGLRQIGQEIGDEGLYDARIHILPIDMLPIELYSQRKEYYENAWTVENGLYQIKNGGRVGIQPNNNLKWSAWGEDGFMSDGNNRSEAGTDVQWKILPEPYCLTTSWRGVLYGFRWKNPAYFSPQSFWEQSVNLDWCQYIGDEELFWGSLRTYYDIGCGYGWDESGKPNYRLRAGLHHDINENWSIHLEGAVQQGSEYQQQRIDMHFKLLF